MHFLCWNNSRKAAPYDSSNWVRLHIDSKPKLEIDDVRYRNIRYLLVNCRSSSVDPLQLQRYRIPRMYLRTQVCINLASNNSYSSGIINLNYDCFNSNLPTITQNDMQLSLRFQLRWIDIGYWRPLQLL